MPWGQRGEEGVCTVKGRVEKKGQAEEEGDCNSGAYRYISPPPHLKMCPLPCLRVRPTRAPLDSGSVNGVRLP